MTKLVHIEKYDSQTFCGFDTFPSDGHGLLRQESWHEDSSAIQGATCQDCLLGVYMLGDSAIIALKRMGLYVEVHDVADEAS